MRKTSLNVFGLGAVVLTMTAPAFAWTPIKPTDCNAIHQPKILRFGGSTPSSENDVVMSGARTATRVSHERHIIANAWVATDARVPGPVHGRRSDPDGLEVGQHRREPGEHSADRLPPYHDLHAHLLCCRRGGRGRLRHRRTEKLRGRSPTSSGSTSAPALRPPAPAHRLFSRQPTGSRGCCRGRATWSTPASRRTPPPATSPSQWPDNPAHRFALHASCGGVPTEASFTARDISDTAPRFIHLDSCASDVTIAVSSTTGAGGFNLVQHFHKAAHHMRLGVGTLHRAHRAGRASRRAPARRAGRPRLLRRHRRGAIRRRVRSLSQQQLRLRRRARVQHLLSPQARPRVPSRCSTAVATRQAARERRTTRPAS